MTETKENQCEGWVRHGGAFSFGPTTWVQCTEIGVVMLTVKQGKTTSTLPACLTCWQKCIDDTEIKIIYVVPILHKEIQNA